MFGQHKLLFSAAIPELLSKLLLDTSVCVCGGGIHSIQKCCRVSQCTLPNPRLLKKEKLSENGSNYQAGTPVIKEATLLSLE